MNKKNRLKLLFPGLILICITFFSSCLGKIQKESPIGNKDFLNFFIKNHSKPDEFIEIIPEIIQPSKIFSTIKGIESVEYFFISPNDLGNKYISLDSLEHEHASSPLGLSPPFHNGYISKKTKNKYLITSIYLPFIIRPQNYFVIAQPGGYFLLFDSNENGIFLKKEILGELN